MDAQASDGRRPDRIGRMVALPGRARQGRPEEISLVLVGSTSRRFSVGFRQRQETSQIISTLEALAVLLSLKLFAAPQPDGQKRRVTILPTWTDNRGNGSALNKVMTTRYPSSALVMELAAEMKKGSVRAQVEWTPREFNREADALANGDSSQFSPGLELRVEPHTLKWHVLDRALALGLEAEGAHDRLKRRGSLPNLVGAGGRVLCGRDRKNGALAAVV